MSVMSLHPVTGEPAPVEFEPRRLIVAGFTGRDRASVEAHIEELTSQGVPRPDSTPTFYDLPVSLLTAECRIAVEGAETSGEVEPVVFFAEDGAYVGVGSDHTSRALERIDIALSKAACPKVVGTNVIRYDDALSRWPELLLRSYVGDGELYQEGLATELLPIPDVVSRLNARGDEMTPGTVLFMGTLALKAPSFVFSDRWTVEMVLPDGPTLRCTYKVGVATKQPEVMM